jgi:ubiquinone/menaquinone biosynthesis C-methylase UbiE
MRVGVIPETLLERIGLLTGLAPAPLAEGLFSFLLARTVMIGTRLGVFEALAAAPLTASGVAATCGTNARATERLLHALAGCRYLSVSPGDQGTEAHYALTDSARKWLLKDAAGSCRDRMLLQFLEWDWFEHAEEFVRTGAPLDAFARLSDDGWGLYQRGMRAGVEPLAAELACRIPLKGAPTHMLDVGGGHGHYSVALCRRHPTLSSTILELPEAIRHAAPVLAREGMGDRIVHRAGDALRDDLGDGELDLVLLASVMHHFDDDQCKALLGRVARALKPGGVVAVFDVFRRGPGSQPSQVGGLLDLFLATISPSGTRAATEVAAFQREAGLVPRRAIHLRIAPDIGAQCAIKPA